MNKVVVGILGTLGGLAIGGYSAYIVTKNFYEEQIDKYEAYFNDEYEKLEKEFNDLVDQLNGGEIVAGEDIPEDVVITEENEKRLPIISNTRLEEIIRDSEDHYEEEQRVVEKERVVHQTISNTYNVNNPSPMDRPMDISEDMYEQGDPDLENEEMHFYLYDHMLCWSNDELVPHPAVCLGIDYAQRLEEARKHGKREFFVRNIGQGMDFKVIILDESYEESIVKRDMEIGYEEN